jgi:hypothetical protein
MRLTTCHPRNPTSRFRWTLLARPILPPLIGSVHGRLEFEDTGGPHNDEEPAAAGFPEDGRLAVWSVFHLARAHRLQRGHLGVPIDQHRVLSRILARLT